VILFSSPSRNSLNLEGGKIFNKRKIREIVKYLICWKRFTVENNIWEREKDLENMKKSVAKFKERLSTEVKKQEK